VDQGVGPEFKPNTAKKEKEIMKFDVLEEINAREASGI
jgi:hypothetical protein